MSEPRKIGELLKEWFYNNNRELHDQLYPSLAQKEIDLLTQIQDTKIKMIAVYERMEFESEDEIKRLTAELEQLVHEMHVYHLLQKAGVSC